MRKKVIVAGLVVVAAVASAALLLQSTTADPASAPSQRPSVAGPVAAKKGDERFSALPARGPMGRPAGEPFGSHSWTPPRPAVVSAPVAVAPSAPPMPYRVAGLMMHDGGANVVLARGDRVLTVREGDSLDDGYRVETVKADGVTLIYLPMNLRETLPINSLLAFDALAAKAVVAVAPPTASPSSAPLATSGMATTSEARPAQLRWEGPDRVKAGNTFNVSLKVTSDQPVRASPLALTFDAKLLEAVSVKPGDFFSHGGSFNFRINPAGSIFVGALSPGEAPKDAEFVVITFRPIRAGGTAELRLSSLALHGVSGGAIPHDRPADFRAAIQ